MNKTTSLNRSIPYWLLSGLSLAALAAGGWLVWDNTSTMQSTLLDGTATNIEVYVGQAWITAGAAMLAAGIVGVLLALALGAAKPLRSTTPAVVIDETDRADDQASAAGVSDTSTDSVTDTSESVTEEDLDDQNGNSGSTATATKISVK